MRGPFSRSNNLSEILGSSLGNPVLGWDHADAFRGMGVRSDRSDATKYCHASLQQEQTLPFFFGSVR